MSHTTNMYNFACGDFFEEEAFYLIQRLKKLFGDSEGQRIFDEEISCDNNGTSSHPFRVMCNPEYLDKIKQAYAIPYDP